MSERPGHGPDHGADHGADDWLREALAGAVPEAPVEPGRAGAARRLAARRRRRTTVAVGAAAALAVAVPSLGIALAGGDGGDPAAAPSTTPNEVVPIDCPPPLAEGDTDAGPGTLPQGVVAVRLCEGDGTGFQEPVDALTLGVDELVDLVNTQPETGLGGVCTADMGLGYRLAFGYPGGEVRVVSGELYGCHALTVGDTVRANPEKVWQRAIALLRAQRVGSAPEDVRAPSLSCEPPAGSADGIETSPVARPGEMTAAIACVRYESASEQPARSVPVPAADLRVLMADLAERPRAQGPAYEPCGPDVASITLVGATAWGDRTSLSSWCGVFEAPGGDWVPSGGAQAILDRLVAEAGRSLPSVDASSTPEQVVAAYVDLVNAGDRAGAAALWASAAWAGEPQLPAEGIRIGYKVSRVRELRFISRCCDPVAVEALYWEYDEQDGPSDEPDEMVFALARSDVDAPYRIEGLRPLP